MLLPTLNIADVLLSFFYAFLIIAIGFSIKNRYRHKSYIRYLIPFIYFKILCSYLFALLHLYFYKGGDTFLYFTGAQFIVSQIVEDPGNTLTLLFRGYNYFENLHYNEYYRILGSFSDSATLTICQITSVIQLVAFNQFLSTTILFSSVFSIGVWLIYITMCKLYPDLYNYFAWGILFIPTFGIWSSGILKDPITLCGIGVIFYGVYNFLNWNFNPVIITIVILSIIICLKLKPYILYTFIPAIFLWIQSRTSKSSKNSISKYIFIPILSLTLIVGGYFFLQTVSESAGKYSLEHVQEVAKGFHSWHSYLAETRNQSGYSLGEVEFTPIGIAKKSPEAFVVTYYRPWLFEVTNLPTAMESLQSTILLVFTIVILFRTGFLKVTQLVMRNPDVKAFLLFTILFGIAVGITSYNFGALSRYKMPSLPFFTSTLIIINYLGNKKVKIPTSRRY
jgi:hypothetical protein